MKTARFGDKSNDFHDFFYRFFVPVSSFLGCLRLGFVMCNVPDQLPGVVKLLAESYNPHVRYAAAMALGIACAGTALLEAHNLLQPLMSDPSDFVRPRARGESGLGWPL